MTLQASAGTLRIGTGSVPIVGASLVASGTPDAIRVELAQLHLRAHDGEAMSTLTANGTAQRDTAQPVAGRIDARAVARCRPVTFADLPVFWPAGLAKDVRAWILQNITAGVARDGHADIGLAANADFSAVTVTRATGSLEGDGLTVSWLRPVPPIVQGRAVLRIVDPDTLQIDVAAGRQRLRNGNALTLTGGSVRITGLMQRDQVGAIQADVTGIAAATSLRCCASRGCNLLSQPPGQPEGSRRRRGGDVAATLPLDHR